jgi:hypothetical protein
MENKRQKYMVSYVPLETRHVFVEAESKEKAFEYFLRLNLAFDASNDSENVNIVEVKQVNKGYKPVR